MRRMIGERYELQDRLGHGGMATVYRARDLKLDREVAIKLLADNFAGDEEVRRRFSREARLAARLDHPNVIQVFDVGEEDDRPYIVMEYVDGGTVGDRLKRRRRSLATNEALQLLGQLCEGLGHAHAKKLVHRDIKPQNLLLRESDGCLKITDFGIARVAEETTRLTQAGKVIGTERYMPAERFADARSLGEALATVDGEGGNGVVRRIRSQEPPTRVVAARGPATADWPAPAEIAKRHRSTIGRVAAVLVALALVAGGVLVATDSGGSGTPTKSDGAKQRTRPPTVLPTSSDPAEQ